MKEIMKKQSKNERNQSRHKNIMKTTKSRKMP